MDVIILGSGTLLPDAAHGSPAHLVRYRGRGTLLDCGSGALHAFAREGLDWTRVTRVVLSHFHTDHFGDLAPLLWAWKHGIPKRDQQSRTLIGPTGLVGVVDALAGAFGGFVQEPGSVLGLVELAPGESWTDPVDGVTVRSHPARHTPEAIALRLETGEGSVGYTGDTGPYAPLAEFFAGVDILISECAVPESAGVDNHMSPGDVAAMAVEAGPGRLVLTHVYPGLERRGLADRIRALGYEGAIDVATDGLRLTP